MSYIVKKVEELLKLPQDLCNMCGKCCKISTFKGGLSYEEIKKLADDPNGEPIQVDGARDFLAIFAPYNSIEDARKEGEAFVNLVLERFGNGSKVSFFYCKFLGENGGCLIHEDRPLLCRMYPIPHERTFYHPDCGFEEQATKNWEEIKAILADLQKQNEDVSNQLTEVKNKKKEIS